MKPSGLWCVAVVCAAAACGPVILAADRQRGPEEPKPVKVLQSWHGKLADAGVRKQMPASGIVLDKESWSKLWQAWRGEEKVAAVDFDKQIVLVFTADGPNSVGCEPTHDGKGNIQANAMSTLIGGGKGFGYLMLCISREGVKTVNGKPLSGEKAPAEKPRPRRPGGRPGAVPGSSGDTPDALPPGAAGGGVSGRPGAAPADVSGVVSSPAAGDAQLPPLRELDKVTPEQSVFEGRTWKQPLVLKSEKEAAEHFDADELAKLTKQVDFGKQFVLLFAWRGSGQDKLDSSIAESYPEQIFFRLTPGRTRDLREHVRIYALRANVTWSVK